MDVGEKNEEKREISGQKTPERGDIAVVERDAGDIDGPNAVHMPQGL